MVNSCSVRKRPLRELFNRVYDVNFSGANVLTRTFMPLLLKSTDPRLLFVAGNILDSEVLLRR